MSTIQVLRSLVNGRLTAAAEEIFGVVERTIEQYEGEIDRQRKLLDALEAEMKTLKTDPPQLSVCEEEVPPEQEERSPSLGQEEPEPLQIKVEQEDLWTCQEREQLQCLEEADIIKFTFNPVPVKSEHDGKKPQSSWFNQTQTEENREAEPLVSSSTEQMKTEPDGEDCGVAERLHYNPQQLSVCEEEAPPEQQERNPSLGQEEPEPLQIKEEQEELWTSQEGEQLQGLEAADIIKFTFTPVPVKSEHDEEKPQSSWFNQTQTEENGEAEPLASTSTEQMETEPDGEDCGVSDLEPADDLEPTRDGQLLSSDCSVSETDGSGEWDETGEPQSGLNSLKSKKTHKNKGQSLSNSNKFKSSQGSSRELKLSNQIRSKTVSCKVCGDFFPNGNSLVHHIKLHSSDCGLCGKHLEPTESLKRHLEDHRTCAVCGKMFTTRHDLERHMRVHTGEKPYSCTLCHKRFGHKSDRDKHLRRHTGEKPFSCTLCHKRFGCKFVLKRHMMSHTGEKPFSCTLCQKRFGCKSHLDRHLRCHTGEKPYSCTSCQKRFGCKSDRDRHLRCHTGEKPYSCTLSDKI